jgi:hypothetical protein
MNVYLVKFSGRAEYDTYDACVVVAPSEAAARLMGAKLDRCSDAEMADDYCFNKGRRSGWDAATVTVIGPADDATPRVVLGSFNAG